MLFPEKRKYPRVAETVSFRVGAAPSRWMATRTLNLSCGGVLCLLPEPIPLMTKLEVAFELPASPSGNRPSAREIRCVGVVVRQRPAARSGEPRWYETALFFSDLKAEDRRNLAEFILQRMFSH